jgi:type II secretory pathway component GspD/PulD (secretin)
MLNPSSNKIYIWSLLFLPFIAVSSLAQLYQEPSFDLFGPNESQATETTSLNLQTGPIIPQVNFNNNDISMIFQIISDATGWSIFPTADVSKAKVSLWAKHITAKELLETVVTISGFVYHLKGDVITVMTYDEYTQYYGLSKKVYELKYATADSVNASIKPFLSKLGKSVIHKETNKIVLYETDANLRFITPIIKQLDTPSEDVLIEVINIKYADCSNLSKTLQSVFSNPPEVIRNKSSSQEKQAKPEKDQQQKQTQENLSVGHEKIKIFPIIGANQLVVVGTISDIHRVSDLVVMVDIYSENVVLEVINLQYADSEVVAESLQKLFSERNGRDENRIGSKDKPPLKTTIQEKVQFENELNNVILSPLSSVDVYSLSRTNQLIVRASNSDLEKLKKLIEKIDQYIEPITKNYQFTYVDASEIYKGLDQILNLSNRNRLQGTDPRSRNVRNEGLTLIKETNSILLTAPPSAHRIMSSIVDKVDTAGMYKAGMIKIYKIDNADVEEVAKTIKELLQRETRQPQTTQKMEFESQASQPDAPPQEFSDLTQTEEFVHQIEAKVSVSKSTNSIVVQATARQHRELEKLIEELDRRRKQVLIEAKIIEISHTDNLNVGVELSNASQNTSFFTTFGLSTNLDPTIGIRDITVSPGGTAAVLRPDKVQAILQALKTEGKARITSAPQLLVNDNAIGTINSIAEEPTTQINQGETTTTTSFAGFVQAGTQFAITPHISENKYLRVEYQIILNSFGTKPTDPSIPPPRNTSSIQSEATVPDGFTIVVGGLQTTDESKNVDKVPLLGDIPLLGLAFTNTIIEKQYKTTFLFITTTIVESEDFADLKKISNQALEKVNHNNNIQDEFDAP